MASASPRLTDLRLRLVEDELILENGPAFARRKNPSIKKILVIGGGVTGLTTSWALLDAGYEVTVVSERWASLKDRITSQIAGALWEWPPAVCGQHTNTVSLEKSKRWCMTGYRAFDKLIQFLPAKEHGVRMKMSNFFFHQPIEEMPDQHLKMKEIAAVPDIQGFKRDRTLVTRHSVNQNAGVVDSYQLLAPAIDPDQYMMFLYRVGAERGARLVTGRIDGDLVTQEDELRRQFGVDAIIHATGLNAHELAADSTVYPLRGALIHVVNDGSKFPKLNEALCVSHDAARGDSVEDIVFIVPRNDRTLILGGLAQPDVYSLNLTLDSPEIVRMRKRCNDFVPGLENADYDVSPLVQGLRPLTTDNVRVEREQRWKKDGTASRIVHSYGQGGSGFSFSFGCAADVLNILKGLEAEIEASASVRTHL